MGRPLTHRERLVVELRYADRLTWPEIAAVLETDEETVRRIHDQAKRHLTGPPGRRAK